MNFNFKTFTFILFLQIFSYSSYADFENGFKEYSKGNFVNAFKEWEPLAKKGHSNAQYNLGLMYHNGQGIIKDYTLSGKWLLLASEQGNINAMRLLSTFYASGKGIPLDLNRAYLWAKIAADNEDENSLAIVKVLEKEMSSSEIKDAQNLVLICKSKKLIDC